MTPTATTTAPDTMIGATFNFTSADGTPMQTLGPYPISAWKARAMSTLLDIRTTAADCRAWRRDPIPSAEMQPDSLAALARELRDYAHACRKARWDGTCLESSTQPLVVFGTLLEALGWVVPKLAAHDPSLTALDLAGWNEIVLNGLLLAGRQPNVPPAVDRDLARDGYTTAEFVAEHVHLAADMLLSLYRRLPTNTPAAYALGLTVGAAEDALADVPTVIKDGVRFALGMQRAAEVMPADAAIRERLMARPV